VDRRIAVYTANFNSKDFLRSPIAYKQRDDIDFFAFVDNNEASVVTPYVNITYSLTENDITKNARKLKILGHPVLEAYDLLIWHDANFQLNFEYIDELIAFVDDSAMATFKHPNRNDFYSEAMTCIRVLKDKPLGILRQSIYYFIKGLKTHSGLSSTGILIKKNNSESKLFLNFWYKQVEQFSRRDQLALAFSEHQTPGFVSKIEANIFQSKYAVYHLHTHNSYNTLDNRKPNNYLRWVSFYLVKVLRKIRKWV
jgi:hypothetical protein